MKTTTNTGAATFCSLPGDCRTATPTELVAMIEASIRTVLVHVETSKRTEGVAQLDAQCAVAAERRRLGTYLRTAKRRRIAIRVVAA